MDSIKIYKSGILIADIPYKTKGILKLIAMIEDYLDSLPNEGEEGPDQSPSLFSGDDAPTVTIGGQYGPDGAPCFQLLFCEEKVGKRVLHPFTQNGDVPLWEDGWEEGIVQSVEPDPVWPDVLCAYILTDGGRYHYPLDNLWMPEE